MSLFQSLVADTATSLELLVTGDNDSTRQAEVDGYNRGVRKGNQNRAIEAATKNLNALERDGAAMQNQIELSEAQAQSHINVSAATAGVRGGSVNAQSQSVSRNAAKATRGVNKRIEQQQDPYLAQIGRSTSSLLSIDRQEQQSETSFLQNMFKRAGQIDSTDLMLGESLFAGNGSTSVNELWASNTKKYARYSGEKL